MKGNYVFQSTLGCRPTGLHILSTTGPWAVTVDGVAVVYCGSCRPIEGPLDD